MYDLTIIIPTFNEAGNICKIILAVDDVLKRYSINGQILVVDDHSPDGTSGIVWAMQKDMVNLEMIYRMKDPGLSQSVVDGLLYALSPIIIVMDADFSHPPDHIPVMYREIKKGYDIVIGSRYMDGGGIREWPIKRRVISLGATFLGRILFADITDPVSGFFAVKKEVVATAPLKPRGYKILLEILGKGAWDKVKEIPFEFVDREVGASKLSPRIILDYVKQVGDIALYSLSNHSSAAWREWKKIFRFCLVGFSGIVVNLGILFCAVEFLGVDKGLASLLAIEVSILTNYFGNDLWTFKHKVRPKLGWFGRLVTFNLISGWGAVINYAIFTGLVYLFSVYYLIAQLVGILIAFAWNFFVNRRITWGER